MIAVTAEQLEQVEAEAAEAERKRVEAAREYTGFRTSPTAYEKHQEAELGAHHAAARARTVRGDWEAQQAARDRRAADGEAAARDMAGSVEGLGKSRTAAVAAAAEAAAAMGRALAALDAHDRLVRAASAGLEERGLRCVEGELTGANLDGSLWVGGTRWPLVDGAGVLGHCLAEQVAGLYPRHPLARPVAASYGGVSAAEGRGEVLALVRAERGR